MTPSTQPSLLEMMEAFPALPEGEYLEHQIPHFYREIGVFPNPNPTPEPPKTDKEVAVLGKLATYITKVYRLSKNHGQR